MTLEGPAGAFAGPGDDDPVRLDGLVLEAAALPADEQEGFLDRLEEEDAVLAAEVRRRLRAAGEIDEDFLHSAATEIYQSLLDEATPTDGSADPFEPPAGDDRFEIGACLGVGGMAHVYHAFDRQLGRPVALKILSSTDPETPRRLLREARAQARVRHDHVLDVYETGELDGKPYIAVRYAAGGTLADLIDSDARTGDLSLEHRVRLMAQAAEGLHAAHREGLLHGDVKPSNVLVEETPDGDLQAWIGDFGIAVDLSEEGRGALLAGTPEYMAPELGRSFWSGRSGRSDRRTDVFSLGVTLFQTLAGDAREERPVPAAGAGRAELQDLAPGLPPDLLAVVARCIAEDPADRYPSARAVAEDLHRFLDGEVVSAYADHLAYRWARFASRHRRLLAVAGVSAVLLAAALVVAAVMGVRAVRANAVADQRRAQAEELIGFTLLDLRDKLEPVGRLELLDDVGERAMRYFAAVPESELSDEELASRSMALYQIADVRMTRGDLAGAERPLEESLALARALAGRDPDNPERLFGLGQSEFWVGYARWRRSDLETARRHFEAYEEISKRLVARDPERADWRAELSYAHSNLGSVLEAQGDLDGALERFRSTLEIDRRLAAETADPAEAAERRFELAATHNTIGVVLERLGRLDEAREHYEADLAIRRALDEHDPSNRRWKGFLGTSQQFLGDLDLALGDLELARSHLVPSRDLFAALTEHDPDNTTWRYKLAWSELRLGMLEHAAGNREAAREAWARAARLARDLTAIDPDRFEWRLLQGLARLLSAPEPASAGPRSADGPVLEVVELLGSLAAKRPEHSQVHGWLARALLRLGDGQAARGDPGAARSSWERAAAVLAPFAEAGTRDHELLVPWERALDRLGRREEAARVRATLDAIGVAPAPPDP